MKHEPGPLSLRVMEELQKVVDAHLAAAARYYPCIRNYHIHDEEMRADGMTKVIKLIKKGKIDFDRDMNDATEESPQN